MKINPIFTLLSTLLTALLAYTFYSISSQESDFSKTMAVTSGVSILVTTLMLLAISETNTRRVVNYRIVSFIFLVTFIGEHIALSDGGTTSMAIIIVGITLVIYLMLLYAINQIKM